MRRGRVSSVFGAGGAVVMARDASVFGDVWLRAAVFGVSALCVLQPANTNIELIPNAISRFPNIITLPLGISIVSAYATGEERVPCTLR